MTPFEAIGQTVKYNSNNEMIGHRILEELRYGNH